MLDARPNGHGYTSGNNLSVRLLPFSLSHNQQFPFLSLSLPLALEAISQCENR